MTPRELAVVAFVAAGVFFAFVAAVGLLRLPDLYTRAHAASKSDTLGVVLSLAAVALALDSAVPTAKTVLLALFMLLTSPTAAHAISRAAYDQGIEPWTRETGAGAGAGADADASAARTGSSAHDAEEGSP